MPIARLSGCTDDFCKAFRMRTGTEARQFFRPGKVSLRIIFGAWSAPIGQSTLTSLGLVHVAHSSSEPRRAGFEFLHNLHQLWGACLLPDPALHHSRGQIWFCLCLVCPWPTASPPHRLLLLTGAAQSPLIPSAGPQNRAVIPMSMPSFTSKALTRLPLWARRP